MRGIILVILVLFSSVDLFSQINLSIEDDCLSKNSAIISEAMIEVFGEDSVKVWVNDGMLFIAKVDSLGQLLNINLIRGFGRNKRVVTQNFTGQIEKFLIEHKLRFYICYARDPIDITEEIILKDLRKRMKEKNEYIINFSFPEQRVLMYSPELEKEEALSKYNYMLSLIKQYNKPSE